MSSPTTIEEARVFWAKIAKEHGWYEEPFYVQVWVNEDNEIQDSVSIRGLKRDVIIRDVDGIETEIPSLDYVPTDTIKGHKIYLVQELSQITPVIDTDTDGSVILDSYSDIVDVYNTQLMCDTCEEQGLDIYSTHQISREWQAY